MDDEVSAPLPASAELPTRAVRMRVKPWPFLYSVDPIGLVRNLRATALAPTATSANAVEARPGGGDALSPSDAPTQPEPDATPPARTVVRGWRGRASTTRARPAAERGDAAPF